MSHHSRQITVFGTCVTYDILDYYNQEISNFGFDICDLGYKILPNRVSSLMVKPGPIAERLADEMSKTISLFPPEVRRQYREIVKPISIDDFLNSIKHNTLTDIAAVDLHGELYPTYDDGVENFCILPNFNKVINYFPVWLKEKLTSKFIFKADVLPKSIGDAHHRRNVEFMNYLIRKFNNRVMLIGNVLTDRIYIPELGIAGQSLKIKELQGPLSFFTSSSTNDDSPLNFEYLSRINDMFYRKTKHLFPSAYYIHCNRNEVCMDLSHPRGVWPTHLHSSSYTQFRQPIIDAISSILNSAPSIVNSSGLSISSTY